MSPDEREFRQRVDETLDMLTRHMELNTEQTVSTGVKLDDLIRRTTPVLEIHEGLIRGAAIIGRTADFMERWGKRFVVLGLYGLALFAATRVLFSGGGWSETLRAFAAIIAKDIK